MLYFIFVAVLNGIIIGMSRAINSRLSTNIGPFQASFWNHTVGFIFTSIIVITIGDLNYNSVSQIPIYCYLGGFFGALFVAVNSYVFPRLGATNTSLLVISGQMVSSVLISYKDKTFLSLIMQILGVAIIIFGVYLSKITSSKKQD